MPVADNPQPARFDINASVVFRLGEELITDSVQALVELVKNSYDADATWVSVTIDTRAKNRWGRKYTDATGAILVEDNGHGMGEPTIRRGWLTIANSPKREAKATGQVTRLGRTPIGDKGLGRLGSQRLARNVEIVTRPREEPTTEHFIAFSWEDFRDSSRLGEVPVWYRQSSISGKPQGTKLILTGLREPEEWQTEEHLLGLQRKLSGMISPFQAARDFRVRLAVDGKKLVLAEIAKKVRETALLKYVFEFDGRTLRISGVARLRYFQPRSKSDQMLFNSIYRQDDGRALYEFLAGKTGKGRPDHFVLSERKGWFVEFGTERLLDDLDRVRRTHNSAADPGPFNGEVDYVSLDRSDFKDDIVGRQSEYRRLVRDLAGIRVYRDGFGIRVGEDWLGLGRQWTGAASYYGLRPGNVLGFVAISARNNPDLVETTSREGFQVTRHYENFFALLTEFVRFAGDTQEFLRRGVVSFLNEHRDQNAGVAPEDPHSAVTQRIDDIAGKLSSEKRKVQRHTGSLGKATKGAAKTLGNVRNELGRTLDEDSPASKALENLEQELSVVSIEAARKEKMLEEVSATLDNASELKAMRTVLDRRWETLNAQVSALYESISLGLTAEALSHEIHNIADRLARKSTQLLRALDKGARKASIVAYIEHVRSSVAAMRKQLAHLTPSLRYLRERREPINVSSWAKELAEFHNETLAPNGIKVVVRSRSPDFTVNMNEGKLTQIFDNLILNAQYWLKEAVRAGTVENAEITIIVDAPVVTVRDNGRGVEERVEDALFEPFVTTKRSGEGRGLGLFVVRQLLDSESCGIMLLPDRNDRGRRYVFELDFSGAASG